MNPVRWKYLSLAFLVISIAFLGSTYALPQVRSPQDTTYHGPSVPYLNGTSALSGYYIPTVDKGSQVNITFTDFVPRKVQISVFATEPGNIAPIPGVLPVYVGTLISNSTFSFKALETQPYGVYVISYDGTTFDVRVRATYSPYYWLNTYSSLGVIAVLCTGILFYYYTFTSKRWKNEQRAIREATGSSSSGVRRRPNTSTLSGNPSASDARHGLLLKSTEARLAHCGRVALYAVGDAPAPPAHSRIPEDGSERGP